MVKKLFGRGERKPSEGTADLQLAAERGRALVEESREIVVVLDAERRVLGASRRAREALEGVVEGAAFPVELETAGGRVPLEVSYDVDGRRETLLYLSNPGDLAAYQELRAGFTAAVSHELRTPLARLLALLETALLPGADQSELIDQARAEVDAIRELIDDVLFLSELESGRAVVSLGSIRARSVIQQVVTGLAPSAERAGIELEVDCPASFELPLRQRMLGVVVENLVANAIRYAGEGATCSVSVRSRRRPRHVDRLRQRPRRSRRRPGAPVRALLPRRPGALDTRNGPRPRHRQARRGGGRRNGRRLANRGRRADGDVLVPGARRGLIYGPGAMRIRLTPQRREFFDLLATASGNAVDIARLLLELLERFPEDGAELVGRIKSHEHKGDDVTREVVGLLNRTFVTPFDRDDIYRLAMALDDVCDFVDDAADHLDSYGVEQVPRHAREQADVILRAAVKLDEAVRRLDGFNDSTLQLQELQELEDEGDRLVRDGVAELFHSETDPIAIIRWKDIHERLEDAIDACENAADVLEAILVKNR